ncbi:xanthine permease [Ligilactobacillus equi DPC 6820]|uniref:Xanthine permease n=1 Tax=Ligilactobacillus equi DPC 6820 TaxID=1392007 RepID=V7HVF8_9LACO|nr:xanthine permease [Ligilactobacillus equi DPC 6820]
MFSMISVQGIRMLIKIDFTNEKNLIIMAVSMGLGLGVSVYSNIFQFLPQALQLLFANGIVISSISSVLLNLILNGLHQKN